MLFYETNKFTKKYITSSNGYSLGTVYDVKLQESPEYSCYVLSSSTNEVVKYNRSLKFIAKTKLPDYSGIVETR